jgi:flagellar basal-body rod protein FlgB
MQVSELKHRVFSQNLANVNTPGYQRLKVDFDEALSQHLGAGDGGELALEPQVVADGSRSARADGNTVDIDLEIGELQRNALMYQTYSQILASQFGTMRRAISGQS